MGRLFFSLVLLLYLGIQGFGQQTKVDSLLQVVRTMGTDSVKARVLADISYEYYHLRLLDPARYYADSTEIISKKIGYEQGVVWANYRYALIDMILGNYEKSIKHLGYCYEYYSKINDSLQMAHVHFQIGKVYKNLGDFDQSLADFFFAAKLFEELNYHKGLANSWNSIASIYRQLNKKNEAIDYYHQANSVRRSLGDTLNYAMGLQNLANVYSHYQYYDSAETLYLEALELIEQIGRIYEESIILGNLGKLFNNLNEHHKALEYHLEAMPLREQIGNKKSIAYGLWNIALTRMKLTQQEEANILIDEALDLAHEIDAKDLLSEFYELKSDIALTQNDFRQAYEYNKISNQWKDSVFNDESTRQINELQAKYETEKKDKQIKVLAKEKEIQKKETQRQATLKWTFIFGVVLLGLVLGLVISNSRQRLKNQKLIAAKDNEIREANYRQQVSELEMKALRAQINPHFLFNCMNSINGMILEGDNDNASLYLTKFSRLVRLILENAEGSSVTLQSEIALLESYIQLEALRFKGKINYNISIKKDIDPNATYLPSMILQPFVENAIWHGLIHKTDDQPGVIEIAVMEKDGRLYCTIEDNGVGREKARKLSEKSVLKSRSMGLKITEERLRLLSKEQWKKLVNIIDLRDSLDRAVGTRVEINIPISA